MIFYVAYDAFAKRHLCATQADAKIVNRKFEQIDIPTDKAGLLEFVQALYTELDANDRAGSAEVIEADTEDGPLNRGGVEECGFMPERTDYTTWSVAIDDAWDKLPLARQLHFAALAMEYAREQL